MKHNNSGVAIILVISILAVLTSLGAAFLIAARLETLKTLNFKEGMRASYVAEAGLAHAKGLLKEDKQSTLTDTYDETWHTAFVGGDVDNDGDGLFEAKWINLVDSDGVLYGRYAVTVMDEASRINVNAAGFHNTDELKVTEGYSTFEVSLDKFFSVLGLSSSEQMRDDVISYRYGGNYPGSSQEGEDDNNNNTYISNDGLDNDADGFVDEPDEGVNEPQEFVSYYPYGDDRPFFSIFELKNIPSVKSDFSQIRPFISAYSFDRNTDKDRTLRLDLNQATALEIANVFSSVALTEYGQLAVNIVDYRDIDYESTVLVYDEKKYYGVEGIRINELMVSPRYECYATSLTNPTGPGGDWTLATDHYENSNPTMDEFGRGIWHFEGLKPGTYYLRMYATAGGETIGDVKVGGITHTSMKHGDMFVEPVVVGENGRLDVTIYNREVDKGESFTTYFKTLWLIESPDAEYIELINITNNSIDVSGWTIEGLRNLDLIAIIPPGTIIESFDYLILAVDKDDTNITVPGNLKNNGISFSDVWSDAPISADKVIQLEFSDTISREDDIINDYPSVFSNILLLKTSEQKIVDRVEYFEDYYENVSFERGDPTSVDDKDGDSVFDNWASSSGFPFVLPLGTPTAENNNISISGHVIGGINSEVRVKNGFIANVGEVVHISTESVWTNTSSSDLMQFCDKFTTNSYRLEAEGHITEGGGWQEASRSSPYTDWFVSTSYGDTGTWEFSRHDRFLDGLYTLTICGKYGEAFSVSLKTKEGSWTDFTPALTPAPDNCVRYGIIDVGGDASEALPSTTVEIKIKNESSTGECHFDALILSPVNMVQGRINVNTAEKEVLQGMPDITDEIADNIVNNRPYGIIYGIGDILADDILGNTEDKKREVFKKICNLITIKSDVFEIMVTGQSFFMDKKTGEKKLRVIVER